MSKINRKPIIIAALTIAVYVILSLVEVRGMMFYFFSSILWGLLVLSIFIIPGFPKLNFPIKKSIVNTAILIAAIQIFVHIDIGFLTGFGRSPLSFTLIGVLINIIYVFTSLIGKEFSRSYLIKSGKKRPILIMSLISVFYTFIDISIKSFIDVFIEFTPFNFVSYMGSTLLPTLSENILITYLTFLGGPFAALAYRSPIEAFEWFMPILPDLNWGFEVLIGVLVPMLGFIYVSQIASPMQLSLFGAIHGNREKANVRRGQKKERFSLISWSVISVVGILMVWFSTGLLGVFPTVPISGSMRPTMDVGDMAIVAETSVEKIEVGDIIQFWNGEQVVIHRVYDINTENQRMFVTKGDANNGPDPDLVFPSQVLGVVMFIIPKIGWISIYLKSLFIRTSTFFLANDILLYSLMSFITIILAYVTLKSWKKTNIRKIKIRRY